MRQLTLTMRATTLPLLRTLGLLLGLLVLGAAVQVAARPPSGDVPPERAPDIHAEAWINSAPLEPASMRGKVVLVEFWTFGCRNCHNVEPYVKAWHQRYADQGLVVIAVHTPEFDSEKRIERVRAYTQEKGIEYAVPIDNDRQIWRSFRNRYWPAIYVIDKRGHIRHRRIGEGGYASTEAAIQRLLKEPDPR